MNAPFIELYTKNLLSKYLCVPLKAGILKRTGQSPSIFSYKMSVLTSYLAGIIITSPGKIRLGFASLLYAANISQVVS